ncbi:unnamed protein product [Ambrosiozyma monospora]|uniref:Unnamed protein product n=1 Tax=Ambrosiozyma monospora TaxID=43982 RepID=A0A9W6Z349_AMBMO|nr:unnamed protein product [Ambrosiozyma monospora]
MVLADFVTRWIQDASIVSGESCSRAVIARLAHALPQYSTINLNQSQILRWAHGKSRLTTIDFQKAFDRMNHDFLEKRLKETKMPGNIINGIMLLATKQYGQVVSAEREAGNGRDKIQDGRWRHFVQFV